MNEPQGNKATRTSNEKITVNTDTWVDRYGDTLFRYALYRTGDKHAAEDLVQDTLVSALKSASSFASKSSEQTWLLGILKYKVLDHYRRKYNKMNVQTDFSDDIDSSFNERGEWRKQLDQWSDLPDNELSRREFSQVLHLCLSKLPHIQKEVFVLREIDGFDTKEICKDRNLSSTNLWVLLHRARKKLRDCLEINWFKGGNS
jgi:RNA polymerase sigma-70 factor (ECF subfamily)